MNRWLLPLTFGLLLTPSLYAEIVINDGGSHVINSFETEPYRIEDGPAGETTSLEIVDGADMRGQISALEHSFVKISGGQKISGNLNFNNNSTGEIDGGLVASVQTFQSSSLTITNGTVNQLTAREDSSVGIFNVSFQNSGQYAGIYLTINTEVSIYGSHFILTDVADDVFPDTWDQFELSGVFDNGTAFATNVYYLKSDPGNLNLVSAADRDGDGMEDAWEQQIIDADASDAIQTIADVLPEENFDGDDYTNLEEFELGLVPTVQDAPKVDSDGDGMEDAWEQQIIDADVSDAIQTIADVLPEENFDGDDYTNLEEFELGLVPTVQDPPKVVGSGKWFEYQGSFPVYGFNDNPNLPQDTTISISFEYNTDAVYDPTMSDEDLGVSVFKEAFRNIQIQAGSLGNFTISSGDAKLLMADADLFPQQADSISFIGTSATVYTGPSAGGHSFRSFGIGASGLVFVGESPQLPHFQQFQNPRINMRWWSGLEWEDGDPLNIGEIGPSDPWVFSPSFAGPSHTFGGWQTTDLSDHPNLTGDYFDLLETTAEGGDEITISYRIRNTGTVSVGGFGVNFYLSGTPSFHLEKELLGTVTYGGPEPPDLLAPGEAGPLYSVTYTVPTEVESAGTPSEPNHFYIGMVVDPYDFETEFDETDNANMALGIDYDEITINGPAIIKPVRFDAHHLGHDGEGFSPSDPIVIDWEVLNVGYGTAPPFQIEFLFDPPVAIPLEDAYLGSIPIDILESGALKSGTYTGQLPPDGSISYNPLGNSLYKVAPNIDPYPLRWLGTGDYQGGFDYISMIGIPAHLRALNLEINQFADPVFEPADPIPVLSYFDNDSPAVVEDPFAIGFIISRDADIDLNEDLVFTEIAIPNGINRQTILSNTANPALPPDDSPIWRPGTHSYYLAIVVDPDNEINEDTRDDNITPAVFVQRFTVTKQSASGQLPQVGGGVTGGTGSPLNPFQVAAGVGASGLNAAAGSEVFLELPIPEGGRLIEIQLNNTDGAGTISVLSNGLPTADHFDNRVGFNATDDPAIIFLNEPEEGSIYIRIDTQTAITGGTLLVQSTASPDTEAPSLYRAAPFQGKKDVPLNSVVTFVFTEPMDPGVDPGDAIGWTGLPDLNSINYRWSADNRILYCAYLGGLPRDTTISWSLNPEGSLAKLQDVAGNELPSDDDQLEFHTSASSNVGSPDVELVEFFKTKFFYQIDDTPFGAYWYSAGLFVKFSGISTVTSLDLSIPSAEKISDAGEFGNIFQTLEMENSFFDSDELDTGYPEGSYGVDLHTVHDGEVNLTLNTGTGGFPTAPTVLNFPTTQAWDHTQEFTIQWSPIPGGTVDDVIYFSIERGLERDDDLFEAPMAGEAGALDGLSTSITIPANTLPPGRTLNAEVVFVRTSTNDTTQYPGARVISGLASVTQFSIKTLGDPYKPKAVVQHDGTTATVKVTGERGEIYDIYSSDNLADWHYMTTLWLYDDRDGFLSSASFEAPLSSSLDQQFFRLEYAVGE